MGICYSKSEMIEPTIPSRDENKQLSVLKKVEDGADRIDNSEQENTGVDILEKEVRNVKLLFDESATKISACVIHKYEGFTYNPDVFDEEHIYVNINNDPERSIPLKKFKKNKKDLFTSIEDISLLFSGYLVITKYKIFY